MRITIPATYSPWFKPWAMACLLQFVFISNIDAQQVNIIPQPVIFTPGKGNFIFSSATKIYGKGSNVEKSIQFFNNYVKKYYGFTLKRTDNPSQPGIIYIAIENLTHNNDRAENSYYLEIENNKISITSADSIGQFYGIQTLIQLLPVPNIQHPTSNNKLLIPQLTISDYPRFAWRGLHFDVSRHFFPVDYIKKYIDYIALHKMNYFHWHLTDDQGWRIEIKKYPKLTSVGAWRDGTIIGRYPGTGNDSIHYGGFYTQEEIKDVVAYAAKRYITVIPEIEMPGHSMAALAAYPELGTTPEKGYKVAQTWGINDVYNNVLNPSEYTFNFLQDVLDEVMQLFPAAYIHIGGDECSKRWWHESPFCQQLMKEKGIKDEHALQSYFIQRIEKYVNSKGKKIIGWDEILEGGLAPNATVMSWRGEQGGIDAAKQNHDVIMTPGNPVYFDHTQSQNEDSVTIGGYNPIEKVYAYEPIPKELNAEQAKHVLGAQANMWTEYMGNTRKVEYMLFPRLSALSEVLWSQKENRDWKDFEKRLMVQFKRYDLWKVNYSKAYFDLKATVIPTEWNNGLWWRVESNQLNGFVELKYPDRTEKDLKTPTGTDTFFTNVMKTIKELKLNNTFTINRDGEYILSYSDDKHKRLSIIKQSFHFNKATGKKITLTNPASDKYPGDGPFTLVNGVINEKGFARSREFLGFLGNDLEATIDLGKETEIKEVRLHTLTQISSWIYPPKQGFTVMVSNDGINFTMPENEVGTIEPTGGVSKVWFNIAHDVIKARYVKVIAENYGTIPQGNPGAGNKPWLFIDEIEVEGPKGSDLKMN